MPKARMVQADRKPTVTQKPNITTSVCWKTPINTSTHQTLNKLTKILPSTSKVYLILYECILYLLCMDKINLSWRVHKLDGKCLRSDAVNALILYVLSVYGNVLKLHSWYNQINYYLFMHAGHLWIYVASLNVSTRIVYLLVVWILNDL